MGKKFSEMDIEELKKLYKSLYDSVYIIDCFGTSDLVNLHGIERELYKRGYRVIETTKMEIVRGNF